jgi:hypothetical protein
MLCAHAKTFVAVSPATAFDYITQFERFPLYDEKAKTLTVLDRPESNRADVEIVGRFGPMPYRAQFKATIVPGKGYSTEMVSGPVPWARGQFWVRMVAGGCEVSHIEEYRFGWGFIGAIAERLWQPYVQATVEREVRTLKQLLELETLKAGP